MIGSIALLLIFHCAADAQVYPEFQRPWDLSLAQLPERQFSDAEQRLRGGVFDPRAEPLVQDAESFTKRIFHLSTLAVQKTATFTHTSADPSSCAAGREDTVLTEWAVNGPTGGGTLILEDTPFLSVYSLRTHTSPIESQQALVTLLASILVDAKPPLDLTLSSQHFDSAPPGVSAFYSSIRRASSPLRLNVQIEGVTRGDSLFLSLRLTKDFTEGYYMLPPFVPERFPSLAEVARGWTVDALTRAVGASNCPDERDQVLVAELTQRDLSGDQIVSMLTANTRTGDADSLAHRASVLSSTLAAMKRSARTTDYLDPAMEAYSRIGPSAAAAAMTIFSAAAANCSKRAESAALRYVTGAVALGAIHYLGACSTSPQVLATLEQLTVPASLQDVRDAAVEALRKRIGRGQSK